MPYKRPDSSLWQVRRRSLSGFGDTGVLATGASQKRLAERMEQTLVEVAERALLEPAYRAVVEAVIAKRVTLATLQRYVTAGDLPALRTLLTDPPLVEAVAEHLGARPQDRQMEMASRHLIELCPKGAFLSYLRTPKIIEHLCRRSERGEPVTSGRSGQAGELRPRKRNSVRRRLLRYTSDLLRYHLGEAERLTIFAEVHFPAVDDTREVLLEPAEIGRLLDACADVHREYPAGMYDQLAVAIRVALQTSADRGTLLPGGASKAGPRPGLLVRDVRIFVEDEAGTGNGPGGDAYSGEIYLRDSKNVGRKRTVTITDALARMLLELCAGKGPDQPVFDLQYSQMDDKWKRVCKDAGLDGVRFKDLRAQTAIYAERADVPLTTISSTMGHGDQATTRRYQRHKSALSAEQAAAIEREMGTGDGRETHRGTRRAV